MDRTSGGLVDRTSGVLGMVAMDQVIQVSCTFLDPDACGGGQVANRLRAQLVHGGLQDWLADLILLPGIPYTYGWNQPGREKAKKLGISPFTYWDLLTT